MATNIKSLVTSYVDANTVSATNIAMLTFTGLLSSLHLGNGTNFTCTPAIGTNTATYDDCPGRIYVTNVQERNAALPPWNLPAQNAKQMREWSRKWSRRAGQGGMRARARRKAMSQTLATMQFRIDF